MDSDKEAQEEVRRDLERFKGSFALGKGERRGHLIGPVLLFGAIRTLPKYMTLMFLLIIEQFR